jgi:hypothetical protein
MRRGSATAVLRFGWADSQPCASVRVLPSPAGFERGNDAGGLESRRARVAIPIGRTVWGEIWVTAFLLAVAATPVGCRRTEPSPRSGGAAGPSPSPLASASPALPAAGPPDHGAPDAAVPPPSEALPSEPDVGSVGEYKRAVTPWYCRRMVRCGEIGASQLAECLLGEGQSPLPVMDISDMLGIDELARQGRLVFDPSGTGACLAFWKSGRCHVDRFTLPAHCLGGAVPVYYKAAVPPGGKCTRWDECIDGYCSSQAACEGRCIGRTPRGQDCITHCREGDFCPDGTCIPRGEEGEPCMGHWQACRDGLFCDGFRPATDDDEFPTRAIPGRCARPRGSGEPCLTIRSEDICRAELFCDWGADAPTCRERLPQGAECRWIDACADGLTCVGLRLGGAGPHGSRRAVLSGGRCLPFADVGQPCEPDAYVTGCPASMACDQATRACRSSGHEGDPCDSSSCPPAGPGDPPCQHRVCWGAQYCDPRTKTCTKQLPVGAPCRPPRLGVDDEPCFLGECDRRTHRCRPPRDCRGALPSPPSPRSAFSAIFQTDIGQGTLRYRGGQIP